MVCSGQGLRDKRRLGLSSGGCKTEDGVAKTEAVAEVGKGALWEQEWEKVEQAASSKEQPVPAEGSAGGKKKAKVEVKEEVHAADVDDGEGTELGEIDMDQIEVLWPKGTTWAATHHKAHFCNDLELPPWCLQRKAKRAKPLKRVIAAGESVDLLRSLAIPGCLECYKVLISLV